MATSGGAGPLATRPGEVRSRPAKECFDCGAHMAVGMVATGPASDSARNPDGTFNRVESALAWRCDKCGRIDKLSPDDLWL